MVTPPYGRLGKGHPGGGVRACDRTYEGREFMFGQGGDHRCVYHMTNTPHDISKKQSVQTSDVDHDHHQLSPIKGGNARYFYFAFSGTYAYQSRDPTKVVENVHAG